MKSLFGSHIDLTAKVLDLRLERQNLVMSNIANVNTPGYKPKSLPFEQELQNQLGLDAKGKMARTDKDHMPSVFSADNFKSNVIKEYQPRTIYGDDEVNLDKEVTEMSKNSMLYNALTDVIKKNFTGLQTVITESKA